MIVSTDYWDANFAQVAQADNVECITLALKPTVWDPNCERLFLADFGKYCKERGLDYCLYREVGGTGNVHYHGIMGFQYGKSRKLFTSWFNRYWGRVHVSDKYDTEAWYRYCTKTLYPTPPPDHCDHSGLYLFE